MSEAEIQDKIRAIVGAHPCVVLFRNNVGTSFLQDGSAIRYGLAEGSTDLVGWLRPAGTFVGIEVKTAKGRASAKQKAFVKLGEMSGCAIGFARSVDDALKIVESALDRVAEISPEYRAQIEAARKEFYERRLPQLTGGKR